MTRSSTNELYTRYKELEREFRSSRKHFKSLSLDKLRSPDFNLLSDEEYSEEEEEEEMAETMEQYMSKTRTDYESGELRENTFSGSDNEDANEHIEKVLEIVDLFHVPNITVDQLMLRVFPISLTGVQDSDETLYQAWDRFKELLMKCPQHYLTEIQEVPKWPSNKWLNTLKNGTIEHLEEEVGCEQCNGPHYTKDCPQKEEGKTLEEAYYTQFGGPFQDFIILDMPEYIKVPLILERPFLSTARAKIDVYKRKITLRLDLEARLMGETLVLNRSLDPFLKDFIELNDLNEPFELRRNQGDDLMLTIEEGEVIEEFRTRNKDLDTGIDDYPSYCDDDKKIHIDCPYNLKYEYASSCNTDMGKRKLAADQEPRNFNEDTNTWKDKPNFN
ncbi:hypothetical protein Tco_0332656 [Tanacetum coccineum]